MTIAKPQLDYHLRRNGERSATLQIVVNRQHGVVPTQQRGFFARAPNHEGASPRGLTLFGSTPDKAGVPLCRSNHRQKSSRQRPASLIRDKLLTTVGLQMRSPLLYSHAIHGRCRTFPSLTIRRTPTLGLRPAARSITIFPPQLRSKTAWTA